MTHIEVNEVYGQSVYQIRLRVAITLLPVKGTTPERALEEADRFVATLQKDDFDDLKARYKG